MPPMSTPIHPGAGGLPVGVGGTAVSLLSGGIDSPVASWMMAKRGLALEMVTLFQLPLHLPRGQGKGPGAGPAAYPLVRPPQPVHVGPLYRDSGGTPPQLPRVPLHPAHAPVMMRIAQRVAQRVGAHGLVTGESLGQVASQNHGGHGGHRAGGLSPHLPARGGPWTWKRLSGSPGKSALLKPLSSPTRTAARSSPPANPKTRPSLEEIQEGRGRPGYRRSDRNAMQGIERVVLHP